MNLARTFADRVEHVPYNGVRHLLRGLEKSINEAEDYHRSNPVGATPGFPPELFSKLFWLCQKCSNGIITYGTVWSADATASDLFGDLLVRYGSLLEDVAKRDDAFGKVELHGEEFHVELRDKEFLVPEELGNFRDHTERRIKHLRQQKKNRERTRTAVAEFVVA